MANIILSSTNDTCLQLSGSEAFYRNMDVPSGSTDLRFAFMASLTGSQYTQGFASTVSIFEYMSLVFSDTLGAVPNGTASQYIGHRGNYSDGTNNSYLSVTAASNSGSYVRGFGEWYSGISVLSYIPGKSISGGSTTFYYGFSQDTSKPCLNMLRLYVNSNQLICEMRTVNSNLSSYNFNSIATRNESAADAYLKDCLTNLGNTFAAGAITYSFSSNAEAVTKLNEFKNIFFGWPFYNVILNIHNMGYRSITA